MSDDKDEYHGWNPREKKKPILQYVLIGLICMALAWVLSGTGH